MSGKIQQLDLFKSEKEQFDEFVVKSFKGLFARDHQRKKDLETLAKRNLDLEEIVFRMNSRLNNLTNSDTCHV